jgi:hypothetical protein
VSSASRSVPVPGLPADAGPPNTMTLATAIKTNL